MGGRRLGLWLAAAVVGLGLVHVTVDALASRPSGLAGQDGAPCGLAVAMPCPRDAGMSAVR